MKRARRGSGKLGGQVVKASSSTCIELLLNFTQFARWLCSSWRMLRKAILDCVMNITHHVVAFPGLSSSFYPHDAARPRMILVGSGDILSILLSPRAARVHRVQRGLAGHA